MNGYLMPLLMGVLGSTAYVLRLYLSSLRDRLLNPGFLRSANQDCSLSSLLRVKALPSGSSEARAAPRRKSQAELVTVHALVRPLSFLPTIR